MSSVTVKTRLYGKIKSMKDESLLDEIEEVIDHLSEMNQIYLCLIILELYPRQKDKPFKFYQFGISGNI